MAGKEIRMTDPSFFKINGSVCKNIFHKDDPNGKWHMTNFLVGIYVGKDKQTGKAIYDNIPVVVWADVPVEPGDKVTVTGNIRMSKAKNGEKPYPQLIADDMSGVAFKQKMTPMKRTETVPSNNDEFFSNAQTQMDASADGIPF